MAKRKILVTGALPYANGPIHIGHLVEAVQGDVWVRFQRLRGHDVHYFCADDAHGTATMMRARKIGRSEVELITEMNEAHKADYAAYDISYDYYSSTNSETNRALCHEFWAALRDKDMVREREVHQLFDPEAGTFLADRFVKGTCPNCGAEDQNGDSCDVCGATYAPTDLKDPRSALTGATPEVRSAPHLFVEINQLRDFLIDWTQNPDHLQPQVARYLKEQFLGDDLRDWDISRPDPYFGFEIPDAPGHYWYVWFTAPIGYMATSRDWAVEHQHDWDAWWKRNSDPQGSDRQGSDPQGSDTEVVHFIGKDIIYFHCLFWPSMLKSAGYRLPSRIQVHGMLTVDGQKMSKSKGTFMDARTVAAHLDPQYLRYYFATKLTSKIDDFDLGLEDFVNRVNSDLVGKVVNLASRTAKFVGGIGLSATYPDDGGLFQQAAASGEEIAEAYEACDYAKAMRLIMGLADKANEYVEQHAPWKLRKDPERVEELQNVCTVALNLFRQIVIYLAPVLPRVADKAGELLNDPVAHWDQSQQPLVGTPVSKFQHMMKRLERSQLDAAIEATREASAAFRAEQPEGPLADEPIAETCTIDDFLKVDLRVAEIVAAEPVPKADKLLQLTLDLGGETRNVFAGIKSAYDPATLVGRKVVCVANLQPRKMKFGTSEGMVIAAGPGGEDIFLLSPDDGALPGHRVR